MPHGESPAMNEPTGAVVAKPSSPSKVGSRFTPCARPQETHSLPHAFRRFDVGASLPHAYFRPSEPRAASSHSASVGRRAPCDAQNVLAAVQSTQFIGCCPRSVLLAVQSESNALRSFDSIPGQSFPFARRLHWPSSLHFLY